MKRIFARNGLAYEVTESGDIVRLGPPVLVDELRQAVFRTGDRELDTMLEMARTKFLSPDPRVRRESLEKLWDAWERVKSLEDADKKTSVERLLAQASPDSTFRDRLNAEAKELTELGNRFQIRHSETSQTPIALDEHVDYLFHRLFAMIQLVLRRRGSGGGED